MLKLVRSTLRHATVSSKSAKSHNAFLPKNQVLRATGIFTQFRLGKVGMKCEYMSTSRTIASDGKSDTEAAANDDLITVNWIHKDGTRIVTKSPIGMHLLDVAHKNNIDLEGACEASLACSTCHVIIKDPALYNLLPEPTDEENDMLDLAFGLTETSRLGCQVHLTKELDGMEVLLPAATRNMMVDGYKPPRH